MKVKLGFFYDAWKVLADWVKGESTDKPKVEVDGGSVEVSNLPTTQQVAGTVQVGNLPEVQKITVDEPLPVSINNSIETIAAMDISARPAYTTIAKPTAFVLLNADLDTWVTDGTADWVVV